jgi:hypothetical protein
MSLISIFVVTAFAGKAQADLLLEPYLGYHMSTYSMTGLKDFKSNGLSLGGRVGYQQMGFMIGGDYMTGKWTTDQTPSQDGTPSKLGVFVGYNFPVMLRVYGVYNFQDDLHSSVSGGSDTYKGTGAKLGVGFTGLPFVSINLEYMTTTYTKNNAGSLPSDMNANTYGLTVSVPFTL